MNDWDVQLYGRFGSERQRPSFDLAARIDAAAPREIADLGCGAGASVAALRARWPKARLVGVDSSPAMLARAALAFPEVDWQRADIAQWHPETRYDLIFSNAALQWLDSQESLLPRLLQLLEPNGVLAFQVPANEGSPYHIEPRSLAASPRWAASLGTAKSPLTYHRPEFYYDLLGPLTSRLDIWETIYWHELEDARAIVEWASGTGLRPYLDLLPAESERQAFKDDLAERFRDAFPARRNGKTLLPFRRLFAVGYRRGG